MTVSDLIAQFFAERGCGHVFTVSGAGNIRLLDAIARLGETVIVSCHHEQAAAQAAIGYWRGSGRVAPVVVTCGGGAANVVTGVVSAWMDSIPLFVIAGQESRRNDNLRAYGVQGWPMGRAMREVTKGHTLIDEFCDSLLTITAQYDEMLSGRPGPVVIEVPMDVQGAQV